MHIKDAIHSLGIDHYPIGLGGCKVHKTTLDCCEYDVTAFDGQVKNEIHKIDDIVIRIHHGKINETNPSVLQQYENMQILFDNEWNLKILLSKIKEKQDKIRISCSKSCLVDAAYYATKAKQDISNPLSATWIKCAAYMICDALVLLNSLPRSPTHMLEFIRKSKKNEFAESISNITEILGLERTTQSSLERMVKSTIGFSNLTENNGHGLIIQRKYEYLVSNSLLSDCYFYLGYINKNNVVSIGSELHKKADLIYILRVAMDTEHDPTKLEQQAKFLHKTANDIIHLQNHA